MLNRVFKTLKEIVFDLALSFFFAALFLVIFHLLFSEKINFAISFLQKVTIVNHKQEEKIFLDLKKQRLDHYPSYGVKYGTLKISSISLELPIYHGDTLDILRYGVGHYAGSYFPGEGGSVILAAHNNEGFFRKLPELKSNDEIVVETIYGTFSYQVSHVKIALESDLSSFPIQDEEEVLILYTCYPVYAIGHTDKRYVVYAKRGEVADEN